VAVLFPAPAPDMALQLLALALLLAAALLPDGRGAMLTFKTPPSACSAMP